MAEPNKFVPGAGTLNVKEHTSIDEATGNRRVEIWGFDGANWNRAQVSAAGALSTSGGGGGGGGTVDQGVGGASPWLIKIDQTATNNDVDADIRVGGTAVSNANPVPVSDAGGSLTVDGPLTDTQLRATPVPISGTVTANAGTGSFTVAQATAANLNATVVGTGTFVVQDSQVIVDNNPFTDGTSKVFLGGYVFDEVAGTALTENDAAAGRIDSKRAQVFVIEDETTRGQRATVTAGKALKVDGSAVTQPVSGTVTANAGTGTFTVDTELAAASALSDSFANPTTAPVGACDMTWDTVNSKWARMAALYYQSTGAVGATGAGTAVDMSVSPCLNFLMNIVKSGTITNIAVTLEGSTDNVKWYTLVAYSSVSGADGTVTVSGKPARYFRYNVTTIAGGGTETIQILAMRGN